MLTLVYPSLGLASDSSPFFLARCRMTPLTVEQHGLNDRRCHLVRHRRALPPGHELCCVSSTMLAPLRTFHPLLQRLSGRTRRLHGKAARFADVQAKSPGTVILRYSRARPRKRLRERCLCAQRGRSPTGAVPHTRS